MFQIVEEICNVCGNDEQTRDSSLKNVADEGGTTSHNAALPDKSPNVEDRYEPIKIEGQQGTGVWVHHPGTEVAQIWESRKGKNSTHDGEIRGEDANSLESFRLKATNTAQTDSSRLDEIQIESEGGGRTPTKKFLRGWNKISAVFHRRHRNGNLEIPVQSSADCKESPRIKGSTRDKMKNILKHAGSFAACGGSHSRKGSNAVESLESTTTHRDNKDVFLESGSADAAPATSAVQTTSVSCHDSSMSRELTSGTSNETATTNSKPVDNRDHLETI